MKNFLIILAAVLTISASLHGQFKAEAAWWDQGVEILKNLSDTPAEKATVNPGYTEIGDAFKQALRIGAENVVKQLGNLDGFNADPSVHIPLPEEMRTVQNLLAKVGMSQLTEDLELKLNRAAELAAPRAKDLFLSSIKDMTFDDIKKIYEGPENSATKYFQSKMSAPLSKEMQPIIENTLSQVGAVQAYDQVIGQYKTLPFVPDVKANLTEHVINRGIDGIFYYIAKEEAAIRQDPARQTTALLKKVFGVK